MAFAKGNRSHNWNGGKTKDKAGYIRVLCPGHPHATPSGYVYEHRLLMERSLGRPLETKEHVHHKNGDKTDNRIENLELLGASEHATLHSPQGVQRPKTTSQESRILALRAEGKLLKEICAEVSLSEPTVTWVLSKYPIVCGHCGRKFNQQKGLGMHMRRAHIGYQKQPFSEFEL